MADVKKYLQGLGGTKPGSLKMTPELNKRVFELADIFLKQTDIPLETIRKEVFPEKAVRVASEEKEKEKEASDGYHGAFVSAVSLAISKRCMEKGKIPPFHISYAVPMYNEHERMYPYDKDKNPNGQDFVREKAKQLSWVFAGLDEKKYSWDITFVDDGCPNKSGEKAIKIIETSNLKGKCFVAFLQECIDQKIEGFTDMKTTKDSRKGGAVAYGLHLATTKRTPPSPEVQEHLCGITDGDLSLNLALTGSLAQALLGEKDEKVVCALGTRYFEPYSCLAYPEGTLAGPKNNFGPNQMRLVVRHVLRGLLIPSLADVYDMFCLKVLLLFICFFSQLLFTIFYFMYRRLRSERKKKY